MRPTNYLGLAFVASLTLLAAPSALYGQGCTERLSISNVSYRVSISEDPELSTVSWRATVANHEGHALRFVAKITFEDSDGYQVDMDGVSDVIGPGDSRHFTGQVDMSSSDAQRISSVEGRIMGCYQP